MTLYRIVRFFRDGGPIEIIANNLTQQELDTYCQNAEPQNDIDAEWTDGYEAIYDQNNPPQ